MNPDKVKSQPERGEGWLLRLYLLVPFLLVPLASQYCKIRSVSTNAFHYQLASKYAVIFKVIKAKARNQKNQTGLSAIKGSNYGHIN